jgi:hypothetical protein
MDVVGMTISYEGGQLSEEDTLQLFSRLIKGTAWTLQGHYGRTAKMLIDGGFIDKDGTVLKETIL